jgi:hypothetical protein
MYFIYGLFVWVLVLIALVVGSKMYPQFHEDPVEAREDIRELIEELANTSFSGFMTMGAISFMIIVAWPIGLFFVLISFLIFCLGGVPYLLFRNLRVPAQTPEPEADWIVPDNGLPKKTSRSKSR